jgi:hypothetical protein
MLTDAFIWEDMPLTDRDTGSLTMAAWISRIKKISYLITGFACIFHVIQSSVRMLMSDDRPMFYGSWYPFDTSKSPVYELTNITQVTKSVCWYRNIRLLCALYYVKQNKLFIEIEQYGNEYLCFRSVLLRHCFFIYFAELWKILNTYERTLKFLSDELELCCIRKISEDGFNGMKNDKCYTVLIINIYGCQYDRNNTNFILMTALNLIFVINMQWEGPVSFSAYWPAIELLMCQLRRT